MLMAMMDVWVIPVRVPQWHVVGMGARFLCVPRKVMFVLVMLVVDMCMRVGHELMAVLVLMRFGEGQPDTDTR